jgi:hypothetical protein
MKDKESIKKEFERIYWGEYSSDDLFEWVWGKVSDSKINEGTMGIDFAKLADDYLNSGDAFTVHASGVRDFAKWLNDNLAL